MSYLPLANNSPGESGKIFKKNPFDKVLIAQLKRNSYLWLSVLGVRFVVVSD